MTKNTVKESIPYALIDELAEARFPRVEGWLKLKTGERSTRLWLNPLRRQVASYADGSLEITAHETDGSLRDHVYTIAFECVKLRNTFPAALDIGSDTEMKTRLEALQLASILGQ